MFEEKIYQGPSILSMHHHKRSAECLQLVEENKVLKSRLDELERRIQNLSGEFHDVYQSKH